MYLRKPQAQLPQQVELAQGQPKQMLVQKRRQLKKQALYQKQVLLALVRAQGHRAANLQIGSQRKSQPDQLQKLE